MFFKVTKCTPRRLEQPDRLIKSQDSGSIAEKASLY